MTPDRTQSPGEIRDKVIEQLRETSEAALALKTPPFEVMEIFNLLTEIVSTVEAFALPHMGGKTKRAIANGVFKWADQTFGLSKILYKALTGSSFIFKLIPGPLRRLLIEKVMQIAIDLIVLVLNKTIWKPAPHTSTE